MVDVEKYLCGLVPAGRVSSLGHRAQFGQRPLRSSTAHPEGDDSRFNVDDSRFNVDNRQSTEQVTRAGPVVSHNRPLDDEVRGINASIPLLRQYPKRCDITAERAREDRKTCSFNWSGS